MATATKPQLARSAAIRALHAKCSPEGKLVVTRTEAAAAIRELLPLSRSQRWTDALESWAFLIEDEGNDASWAYTQGSIWCGYATDGLLASWNR
jgi:hypothetical protein